LLLLSIVHAYGKDVEPYIDVALSLELIHLYSLVHDDLPAMDDDDFRHGQLTIHKAFDEAMAILVGDGLLTHAFELLSKCSHIEDALKVNLITHLAHAAGHHGMIYGQHLDLIHEHKTIDGNILEQISHYKTGKLIAVACQMGALIGQQKDQQVWEKIGYEMGLLFQIQDDVLEATTSVENMGKSKSDDRNEKATFVSMLGLDISKEKIKNLVLSIENHLEKLSFENDTAIVLIRRILTRQH
jgi:geranylgeranyl diphosphate synthase type II